jgi:branched-chain amino acid transport system substrate-binding protein
MRRKSSLIALFVLVILFAACFSGSLFAADETMKIGVIYSITGAGSTVAKIQLDGINLAIKQINDNGGLNVKGKKLRVEPVIRDDETKPDVGVRRLREMTEEGIKIIVGGTFANVTTAMNEQLLGGQAMLMATNGIQESTFEKKNKAPYFLSSLGAVDAIGRICADYVAKTYKPKEVMLFLPDYAYGRGAAAGANSVFKSKYPDIKVSETWSPTGTPDYTSYINKIREAKPNVVMMGQWGNDSITALKQVYELGLRKDTKIFFNCMITATAVGIPPEALNGVSLGTWWFDDLSGIKDADTEQAVSQLSKVWRAVYNEPPDPFAVYAYVGMQEALRGIELAGSADPALVYKALMSKPDFMSVKGPATWRVDGRPLYKYAYFIAEGKPLDQRKDKWDYCKVVDIYQGQELVKPLAEMGY